MNGMFYRNGIPIVRSPDLIISEKLLRFGIKVVDSEFSENGMISLTVSIGKARWEDKQSYRTFKGPWMTNGEFNLEGFIHAINSESKDLNYVNRMDEALE